jgi:hypothetical protein
MPNWLRAVLAITVGFVVWFVVATVGNFAIRLLFPGYAEVEKAMNFSLAMLLVRLVLGAGASIAAGVACAAVRSSTRLPRYVFALLLFALFVPVHVSLWDHLLHWSCWAQGCRAREAGCERPNNALERTREG